MWLSALGIVDSKSVDIPLLLPVHPIVCVFIPLPRVEVGLGNKDN
jgi:hypothetical protein